MNFKMAENFENFHIAISTIIDWFHVKSNWQEFYNKFLHCALWAFGLFMAFFGTWRKSTHHKWISRWQTILKISTIIDWFHVKSNWQIFTNFYTVHFAPLAFLWPFLALDAKVHITNEFQEGSLKFDDIKHKLDLHSKLQFWLSFP